MAISSFPFDSQDTTEDQYTRLFTELQDTGVIGSVSSSNLAVTATGSSLSVSVAAGSAFVRGHFFESTAIESVSIPVPASGTAIHRIVLRLDPAANSTTIAVVQGTAGAGAPTIKNSATANATGVYEMPLAQVQVTAGALAIAQSNITDDRPFTGGAVGAWVSSTKRPASPRAGRTGWNHTDKRLEVYDGSAWNPVDAPIPVGVVQMWAGGSAPAGWLLCDGTEHNISTYPALGAAIGQTYGGTAGSTFRVPNFNGRSPIGSDGTYAHGSAGGSTTKTIEITNLPDHTHPMNHGHGASSGGAGYQFPQFPPTRNVAQGPSPLEAVAGLPTRAEHSHPVYVNDFSGSTAGVNGGANKTPLDVMNPWLAIKFIIRAV